MARSVGAQFGLLAFGVAILAGLYAGNTPTTVLLRALVLMAAACAAGQFVGWAAKSVLRDYLQQKKTQIDTSHREALQAMARAHQEREREQEVEAAEAAPTVEVS